MKKMIISAFNTSGGGGAPSMGFDGILTSKTNSFAFTLAEVLITLTIIGVVAALMLPPFITNVNEKVYAHREANIALKVTKAMDQMKALGLLSQTYDSTEDFVDELQKFLKISKRCDTDLQNCWPTKTITDANGNEFDVSTVTKSQNINKKDFNSNAVGLVLADGAHIILAYNKNAEPILETAKTTAVFKDYKNDRLAYTTSSTAPIAFMMDVNGGRGPNTENSSKDIRGFHAASFTKGSNCDADYTVGSTSVCYLATSSLKDKMVDCSYKSNDEEKSEDHVKYCAPMKDTFESGKSIDYWAGAKKACADLGMTLPSHEELSALVKADIAQAENGGKRQLPTSGYVWVSDSMYYDRAYLFDLSSNGDSFNYNLYTYKNSLQSAICI